ncbi:MAG: LPS export ABC transporter periplasmic protein LptC [Marinilabiliaceae bacterium]|nr:LPS export ABC transporter periplasmic protein LptC [Marinilabiliaceae bacterium]
MRIQPLELKNKVLIPHIKNSLRTALAASSILLLAVSFGTSCSSNKPEEIKAISNREDLPALSYNELETVITDSGKVKYRFITPEMLSYKYKKEEPYIDFPSGFHLFIYDASGEVETQIKCMNAIYYEKPKELWELNNDVQGINAKGEVLNSEQLFWDMKEERLYTDKFVKITTPTQIITGTGLESDQTLSNWRIKNVSGELEIEE